MSPSASHDDARTVMTNYVPEHYAFHFPNAFVNQVWHGRIPVLGREIAITTRGRCGGMAFASLDFFHHHTPVPQVSSAAFAPAKVPPDGHPLADYIFRRQLHSMLTTAGGLRDGLRYLQWSGAPAPGVSAKTIAEEHKVIASLNRGQPVVLGLIRATSRKLKAQGVNHQVVCYGYRTDAVGHHEFYVYDPNEPYRPAAREDYSVVLTRRHDDRHAAFPYEQTRLGHVDRWRGFFVVRYRPRRPHPAVMNLTNSSQS